MASISMPLMAESQKYKDASHPRMSEESIETIRFETAKKEPTPSRLHHNLSRFLRLLSWSGIVTLSILGLMSLGQQSMRYFKATPDASCYCGETVSEAVSRGCKFDPIAPAWLPDHCRDDSLIEEWNHSGPGPKGAWSYYEDSSGSRELSLHELSMLADSPDPTFFVTHEWHIVHCVFYWRKLHNVRMTGVVIEAKYDGPVHIMHCMMAFKQRDPLQRINSLARVVLNSSELLP